MVLNVKTHGTNTIIFDNSVFSVCTTPWKTLPGFTEMFYEISCLIGL